jgi:glycosyltransferase involved in cell wall biosynthesis
MKRVLIFGMTEVAGGVESFLMNYYRHADKSILQFDFLCNSHNKIAYEDEALAMGSRTYHITARSKNLFLYRKELKQFFDKHANEYDTIWVNLNSLANIDYLKMAKKYGIKRRIVHSHNASNMDSKLRGLLHRINRKQIKKYATDYWACSNAAASWFYPKELMSSVQIITNAIDVDKTKFDDNKRKKYRQIVKNYCDDDNTDQYIIGNVGRLHFQKNQLFILDIFAQLEKELPQARLVLVGIGPDEAELKNKAKELDISKKVYFAGQSNDIQGWLSAMDLLLFPSKFEGLSIAALEAQANGLPVLASSKVIPESVHINRNYHVLSLEEPCDQWCKRIIEIKQNEHREKQNVIKNNFQKAGFDIDKSSSALYEFLLG